MKSFKNTLNRKGQGFIEYALIIVLVVLGLIAAAGGFRNQLSTGMSKSGSRIIAST